MQEMPNVNQLTSELKAVREELNELRAREFELKLAIHQELDGLGVDKLLFPDHRVTRSRPRMFVTVQDEHRVPGIFYSVQFDKQAAREFCTNTGAPPDGCVVDLRPGYLRVV